MRVQKDVMHRQPRVMDTANGKKDQYTVSSRRNDHFDTHRQMGMVLINRDRREFHECVLNKGLE